MSSDDDDFVDVNDYGDDYYDLYHIEGWNSMKVHVDDCNYID